MVELNNPLVSIIINCFNGERYLKQALISVLNQSYKNWELIFWDNRSTDNSKNILNTLKENGFYEDIDLFSIDIDGVDYWALKELPNEFSKIIF